MDKFVVILANGQTVDIEGCSIGVAGDDSFHPVAIEDLMNIWSAVIVAQDDVMIMADINDESDPEWIAAKQEFNDICANLFTADYGDENTGEIPVGDDDVVDPFYRPAKKEEYEN